MEELETLQEESQTLELYKDGKEYRREGYKVSDLWTMQTRIVSSFDKMDDSNEGLTQGRIDIGWLYWKDSRIKPHRFILTLGNGSELDVEHLEDFHSSLNFKNPIVYTDGGVVIEFAMSSNVVGVTKLKMVYIDDADEWIKLNKAPIGAHTSPPLTIKPNSDFDLLIRDTSGNTIYNYKIDATVPYPMSNIKFDLGKHLVTFQQADTIVIQSVAQSSMDTVWIRYNTGYGGSYGGSVGGNCTCNLNEYYPRSGGLLNGKVEIRRKTPAIEFYNTDPNDDTKVSLYESSKLLKVRLENTKGQQANTYLFGRGDTVAKSGDHVVRFKDLPVGYSLEDEEYSHDYYKRELQRLNDKIIELENK